MKRIALIVALVLPSALVAESRDVEISASDGLQLAGTVWTSEPGAPGLLLMHQYNADRTMYDNLGSQLAEAGFTVLAYDHRGLGGSTNADFDLAKNGTEADWDKASAKFPEDAEAAHQFLENEMGVDVIGSLGASCGGGLQIALAAAHSKLATLTFLSSSLTAIHVRDAMGLRTQYMLFIHAKRDRGASEAGTIAYRVGKTRSEMILYDGDSHGYPLFSEDPELEGKIVDWFVAGRGRGQ
jgi:alpha-beta hydrolase superfamily lysophospholipase